jgi:hypothetical protein
VTKICSRPPDPGSTAQVNEPNRYATVQSRVLHWNPMVPNILLSLIFMAVRCGSNSPYVSSHLSPRAAASVLQARRSVTRIKLLGALGPYLHPRSMLHGVLAMANAIVNFIPVFRRRRALVTPWGGLFALAMPDDELSSTQTIPPPFSRSHTLGTIH